MDLRILLLYLVYLKVEKPEDIWDGSMKDR